ncbi:MAG TPA: ATP-dependent DNA helicase UvrD2 [Acidimicrobiia bacterium]|nr:ATP-dependent DNA helicase UvrD2 [Acidimicrobiia bacterium]
MKLLAGLDPSQRAAVTETAAPLAILAGAGSGKTRVLTHRIAWQAREGAIEADHVLAVTFTRKAAGELVTRLGRLGVRDRVTAGTFHAIALAQLRARQRDRDRPMPELIERKAPLLIELLRNRGGAGRTSRDEVSLLARDLAGEIEWAKARLIGPGRYAEEVTQMGRETPRPPSEVADVYQRYEDAKRRRNRLDFDDLILWCARTLTTDKTFGEAQRWRFRHLFVDEFQDVSPAQFELVRAWLGTRTDLCVVGDPDQAIYGFAGAHSAYLGDFDRHFPGATVVRLGANYRSTPQIVTAARAVLADGSRRPLPPVQVPQTDGSVPTVAAYDSDEEEARAVARELRRAHDDGIRWGRLAVLYRTNAQSAGFEAAFGAARIPVRLRGAGRFLGRPEVRATLDHLSAAARDAPRLSFSQHMRDLVEESSDLGEERREHIDALSRLGQEYVAAEGGAGSIDGFLAYLTTALRGDDGPTSGDAVELLTFHRAKGLEFDTVWVTGLETGLVPISFADTTASRAEERRLLYVACSRAERTLHLSWARQRTARGRLVRRRASPWVAVVEAALGPVADAAAPPVDPKAEVAKARAQLGTGARGDPRLVTALTEWRRDLARAHGIPAYVIFNNATLEEVARTQPANRSELLEVSGIGPVKVERYGDTVLDLVRTHAPESGDTDSEIDADTDTDAGPESGDTDTDTGPTDVDAIPPARAQSDAPVP